MPMDMILTNNANIKIKEVIRGNKIILECEDKTEYYCPKCGSYHLRCKDTFIRNIKNISIGEKAMRKPVFYDLRPINTVAKTVAVILIPHRKDY